MYRRSESIDVTWSWSKSRQEYVNIIPYCRIVSLSFMVVLTLKVIKTKP